MYTDKIQINHKHYKVDDIQHILINTKLPKWEQSIYKFILNWFDQSNSILQQTSGSTGNPKEIKLNKSAMIASATNTVNFFQLQKNDTAWLCLPINYIAGKMMVVRAIVGELNLLISNPKGSPELPKNRIDFTAMVPLQIQKLIQNETNLSNIKTIIIGGAAVDFKLQKTIQNIPSVIYATYGMTETSSHIALQKLNGKHAEKYFKVLARIKISTNTETCLIIDAPLLNPNPIQTNDIVEIVSPSEFKWLGRADNVINSGGLKISPEELENQISSIINRECLIVPEKDELLGEKIVLVLEGSANKPLAEKILIKIKSMVDKHRVPKAVYYLEHFPRNESMKIDRKKVIENLNINL